jgi:hypothetical protein
MVTQVWKLFGLTIELLGIFIMLFWLSYCVIKCNGLK